MPKKATKKTTEKKKTAKVKRANAGASPALTNEVVTQIVDRFFQVVGDLRSQTESKQFLLDFLTESERITFAKRLAIALELQAGKSYEEVRKLYGVSSATISTVASMMKSDGMKLAFRKIDTDNWAAKMNEKFLKVFGVKEGS